MRLSPAQRRVLNNLVRGKAIEFGQNKGAHLTLPVLREKGMIDQHGRITDKGRADIEQPVN